MRHGEIDTIYLRNATSRHSFSNPEFRSKTKFRNAALSFFENGRVCVGVAPTGEIYETSNKSAELAKDGINFDFGYYGRAYIYWISYDKDLRIVFVADKRNDSMGADGDKIDEEWIEEHCHQDVSDSDDYQPLINRESDSPSSSDDDDVNTSLLPELEEEPLIRKVKREAEALAAPKAKKVKSCC
jgi:hypothetical protein